MLALLRRFDPGLLVVAVLVVPFLAGILASRFRPDDAPVPLVPRVSDEQPARPPRPEPTRALVDLDLVERSRGQEMRIGGRAVQLPPDAYVARFVPDVICLSGLACPEPPLLEIHRGNASVVVSVATGLLAQPPLTPEEREAFAFLLDGVPARGRISPASDFDFVGAN